MNEIDELIKAADKLCQSLETSADNESRFCENICDMLQYMSRDVFKIKSELEQMKEYYR